MTRADTREEVYRAIERRGGGTSTELADALGYERGTVAQLCKELREAGRLTRRPDPTNPVRWIHEVRDDATEVRADA